jgi:hypothetical protein
MLGMDVARSKRDHCPANWPPTGRLRLHRPSNDLNLPKLTKWLLRLTLSVMYTVTRDQLFDQALIMRYRSRIYRKVFARPLLRKLNVRLFYLTVHGLCVLNYENDDVSGETYLIRTRLP